MRENARKVKRGLCKRGIERTQVKLRWKREKSGRKNKYGGLGEGRIEKGMRRGKSNTKYV